MRKKGLIICFIILLNMIFSNTFVFAEVYSVPLQASAVNLSLNKPVTVSHKDNRLSADEIMLTDGIINEGEYFISKASSSYPEMWIEIDLQNAYYCEKIEVAAAVTAQPYDLKLQIFNNDAELWEEAGEFEISFADVDNSVINKFYSYDLPSQKQISKVRLYTSDRVMVAFSEIYVLGYDIDNTVVENVDLINVALNKNATATSYYNNDKLVKPSYAVDGLGSGGGGNLCWISERHSKDAIKEFIVDLGGWYNVRSFNFGSLNGWMNNQWGGKSDSNYQLIDFYGSATGNFENDGIKLADVWLEPLVADTHYDIAVRPLNYVRYIKVKPKNREQFKNLCVINNDDWTCTPNVFGFAEISVFVQKNVEYKLAGDIAGTDEILNNRDYSDSEEISEPKILSVGNVGIPVGMQIISSKTGENQFSIDCALRNEDEFYNTCFDGKAEYFPIKNHSVINLNGGTESKFIRYMPNSGLNSISEILTFYKLYSGDYLLYIENLKFTDGNNEISNINSDVICATGDIINCGTETKNVYAIMALYAPDGNTEKISVQKYEIAPDIKANFNLEINSPVSQRKTGKYAVKVYFIEDLMQIDPYVDTVIFE